MIRRLRSWVAVVLVVLVRPILWRAAIVAYLRLVPSRWWTRRPFVPVPAGDYLRFRKEAYYGSESASFAPQDVLKYLQWIRAWDRGTPGDG